MLVKTQSLIAKKLIMQIQNLAGDVCSFPFWAGMVSGVPRCAFDPFRRTLTLGTFRNVEKTNSPVSQLPQNAYFGHFESFASVTEDSREIRLRSESLGQYGKAVALAHVFRSEIRDQ